MFLRNNSSEKLNELGKTCPSALRVYLKLCAYSGPTVFSAYSLGELVGISPSTASNAIKLLEEAGVIATYKIGTAYVCTILDRNFCDIEWDNEEAQDVNALNTWAIISNSEQENKKEEKSVLHSDGEAEPDEKSIEEKLEEVFPEVKE